MLSKGRISTILYIEMTVLQLQAGSSLIKHLVRSQGFLTQAIMELSITCTRQQMILINQLLNTSAFMLIENRLLPVHLHSNKLGQVHCSHLQFLLKQSLIPMEDQSHMLLQVYLPGLVLIWSVIRSVEFLAMRILAQQSCWSQELITQEQQHRQV